MNITIEEGEWGRKAWTVRINDRFIVDVDSESEAVRIKNRILAEYERIYFSHERIRSFS